MFFGVILSPCFGKIEKIAVNNADRIYEWEELLTIKSDAGAVEIVQTDVSGKIESLEVQEGDNVIPGMVLAYVKEDLFNTGSD
ncbi:biotin/lipoyl-containing protein [Neobacillus sp. PS3-12]|jgi:biotin carboxyl carrier protein|uniref:biotin/lipoyl-containing protein n=1 Tax=Neobacillus sp. PS3-12 TaxID=3070677 RepID=UPI0027E2089E|nr:biotin/lipoyl-binding protein [Neobacillus sp. PS3-12]WML52371.1 biotin/lipoyl-containing protein [Neobacillus sp. PS3-12]